MNNTESKLISAVLQDKQAHVLLQANIENNVSLINKYVKKYGFSF